MTKSNRPMVLVELTPEEVAWLADRLHDYRRQANAVLLTLEGVDADPAIHAALEEHKAVEARLRNRILDSAAKRGFGDL